MKLLKNSPECTKSELDLLLTPYTQTAILSGKWIEIKSKSQLVDGPVEFDVPGVGENYYDLANSYVYFVTSISTNHLTDGTSVKKVNVAPVNLFLHSMFSQLDITLGDETITQSTNLYPYRAMFETLLNYSQDAKESYLGNSLFYKDTAGKMEYADYASNSGFVKRKELTLDKQFELMGRLHADIFMQDRYMLNNVPISITLTRNKPEFCLLGPLEYIPSGGSATKLTYKVNIHVASLFIRQVTLNPDVLIGHAMALEKTTAKYPIKRVEMKNVGISASNSTFSQNLHSGIMPQRVVIGFIDAKALTGHYEKYPFNFHHFKIKEIELKVNDKSVPFNKVMTDFDSQKTLQGYHSLFTGIDKLQEGNFITREDYNKGGYNLFAYDLTSDLCSGAHLDLIENGTLSIEVTFAEVLANAVNMIVYMEMQRMIEITKDRNVITNFKV
jgi:hypothetical protein